jgi:hypothetical protein
MSKDHPQMGQLFNSRRLAFTWCSPKGESQPIGVSLVLSNLLAAMLRYESF